MRYMLLGFTQLIFELLACCRGAFEVFAVNIRLARCMLTVVISGAFEVLVGCLGNVITWPIYVGRVGFVRGVSLCGVCVFVVVGFVSVLFFIDSLCVG